MGKEPRRQNERFGHFDISFFKTETFQVNKFFKQKISQVVEYLASLATKVNLY